MSSTSTPSSNLWPNVVCTIVDTGEEEDTIELIRQVQVIAHDKKAHSIVERARLVAHTNAPSSYLNNFDKNDERKKVKMTFSRTFVKNVLIKASFFNMLLQNVKTCSKSLTHMFVFLN